MSAKVVRKGRLLDELRLRPAISLQWRAREPYEAQMVLATFEQVFSKEKNGGCRLTCTHAFEQCGFVPAETRNERGNSRLRRPGSWRSVPR